MPEQSPRWVLPAAIVALVVGGGLHLHSTTQPAGGWVWAVGLVVCGLPLVWELLKLVRRGVFGADLLAGISIATAIALGEYAAGLIVVTMLAGGQRLEEYASGRASEALRALAERMPRIAHRRAPDGTTTDIGVEEIVAGDVLLLLPHEVVPADGVVVEGQTTMNEAYLTGEPWELQKAPGSTVISGARNGDQQVILRAERPAADSRYAQIVRVMEQSEQNRPQIQRLADRLGAWYTPIAVTVAGAAWALSGEAVRFLAVLVVATPCPLLIAIPVALVGTISQAAKRSIIVRNPAVLERLDTCRTLVLDKTGTLTRGEPVVTAFHVADGQDTDETLVALASLEMYSRHPLAGAVVTYARGKGAVLLPVDRISEPPGAGLTGEVGGRTLQLTSRRRLLATVPAAASQLPPEAAGLEFVALRDGAYLATVQFRDLPREEGAAFIGHVGPKHALQRVRILSGDRQAEVDAVGEQLGITERLGGQSPADKVRVIQEEVARAPTIFVGDGINDGPALAVATVGVAFGRSNEVAVQAADVTLLEPSLARLDELFHLARRFRRIALQSAVGGMALSMVGMGLAAFGLLGPVAGALLQEGIDLASIGNALRTTRPPRQRTDFEGSSARGTAVEAGPDTTAASTR